LSIKLILVLTLVENMPMFAAVVREVAGKYMKKDAVTVDLVGNSVQKAATTVRHLLMQVHWTERKSVLVCPYSESLAFKIIFLID